MKRAAKVPVADPDSGIMPNKEGGYAPNFNPIAAADGECGMIIDAVISRPDQFPQELVAGSRPGSDKK